MMDKNMKDIESIRNYALEFTCINLKYENDTLKNKIKELEGGDVQALKNKVKAVEEERDS